MRRIEGLEALRPDLFRLPVATLGVFDGVHRGHAAVLAETAALAAEVGGEPVAVTFDIHPRVVVEGEGPVMLTSLPHRLLLLERAGMAAAVVLRFDEGLRDLPAETFLEDVLLRRMGIAGLVLGPDSHFGRDRRGNPDLARRLLEPRGVPVRAPGTVEGPRGPISSTAIRRAIAGGDLAGAGEMLGRPVTLMGTVVRGDGRGRGLGYPTANLDLAQELRPPRGVYVGRAALPDGTGHWCLVNVGGRPTFHPEGGRDTVEAWIPGWEGDLYGGVLEVALHALIREERRFAGPEALKAQIALDHAGMVDWIRTRTRGGAPGGGPATGRTGGH